MAVMSSNVECVTTGPYVATHNSRQGVGASIAWAWQAVRGAIEVCPPVAPQRAGGGHVGAAVGGVCLAEQLRTGRGQRWPMTQWHVYAFWRSAAVG